MTPKFRGDGNNWLDDELPKSKRSPGNRAKVAPKARSVGLPWRESNGVVAEVFRNQCRVQIDAIKGQATSLLCSYRRAEVVSKKKDAGRERSPVAVGDRVLVVATDSLSGVIEGICERRNSLSRPAPGREEGSRYHVLAANIDILVVVASAKEPEFSSGLVDRFLVAAEAEGLQVILCLSKMDLHEPGQTPWIIYRQLGYELFEVCAQDGLAVQALRSRIAGQVVVFCGHSGVGKTSLLRALLQDEVGQVRAVNTQTGKGRHTTTGAVLLGGPLHSQWIDTPGVREFGLAQVLPENLSGHFPEFRNLECSGNGCLHQDEPGCQARSMKRYPSYLRILSSLLQK